jgi:branched-subunit amino acid ABC-type transport system permease component
MPLWGKIPPGLVLGAFAFLGAVLIFVPHYWAWQWDFGIIPEVGVAFLVAAILGFTIDRWMKAALPPIGEA